VLTLRPFLLATNTLLFRVGFAGSANARSNLGVDHNRYLIYQLCRVAAGSAPKLPEKIGNKQET
jgi:hypothetical protein